MVKHSWELWLSPGRGILNFHSIRRTFVSKSLLTARAAENLVSVTRKKEKIDFGG